MLSSLLFKRRREDQRPAQEDAKRTKEELARLKEQEKREKKARQKKNKLEQEAKAKEARAAVLIKDLLCVEQQLIEPALAAGTILSVSEISIVDEAVDEGFFPLNDQKGEPPADLVQAVTHTALTAIQNSKALDLSSVCANWGEFTSTALVWINDKTHRSQVLEVLGAGCTQMADMHLQGGGGSSASQRFRLGVTGFLDSRLDPAFQSKLARLRSCRDVLLLRLDISAMNLSDWHSAAEQLMKQQEQDQDESEADADPSLTAAATASEQQANPSSGVLALEAKLDKEVTVVGRVLDAAIQSESQALVLEVITRIEKMAAEGLLTPSHLVQLLTTRWSSTVNMCSSAASLAPTAVDLMHHSAAAQSSQAGSDMWLRPLLGVYNLLLESIHTGSARDEVQELESQVAVMADSLKLLVKCDPQLVADVCGESIRSVTSEQPPGAEPVPDKLRTDLSMMLAGVLEVLQARLNPLPPPAAEADAVAPVATAPDSAEVPPAAAG